MNGNFSMGWDKLRCPYCGGQEDVHLEHVHEWDLTPAEKRLCAELSFHCPHCGCFFSVSFTQHKGETTVTVAESTRKTKENGIMELKRLSRIDELLETCPAAISCGNCVFFVKDKPTGRGRCRRGWPTSVGGAPAHVGWPTVDAEDWCGEIAVGVKIPGSEL